MKKNKKEGGLRTKGYFKKTTYTKPLISIVTVVYNGEQYIEETIHSIINQKSSNIEFIIIDGGSTDRTISIIKKYENQIDYWSSENDKGIYDAMNKGSRIARGKWINFMNCGDTFASKKVISKIPFHNFKKNVMIYGNTKIYNKKRKFIKILKSFRINKLNLLLFVTRVTCHQSVFYNKKIKFKFPNKYKLKGDLFSYFEYLKHGSPIQLNFVICNYFLGGKSSLMKDRDEKETWQVLKHHTNLKRYLYIPMYLFKKTRLFYKT